jgi:nucleoside-triphosphatase THEP1
MRKSFHFADAIKQRNDVRLFTVRADNRDNLVSDITDMLAPRLALSGS